MQVFNADTCQLASDSLQPLYCLVMSSFGEEGYTRSSLLASSVSLTSCLFYCYLLNPPKASRHFIICCRKNWRIASNSSKQRPAISKRPRALSSSVATYADAHDSIRQNCIGHVSCFSQSKGHKVVIEFNIPPRTGNIL